MLMLSVPCGHSLALYFTQVNFSPSSSKLWMWFWFLCLVWRRWISFNQHLHAAHVICPPSFHERLSVLELFLCLTGIVSTTSTVHVYISHSCSWMLSVPRFATGQLESVSLFSLSAGRPFSFVGEKCMHLYVEFGPPRRELPKRKKFLKVKNIKEEEYWMKSGAWRGVFSLHNTSKIYEELFQIGLSVLPLNFLTAT